MESAARLLKSREGSRARSPSTGAVQAVRKMALTGKFDKASDILALAASLATSSAGNEKYPPKKS